MPLLMTFLFFTIIILSYIGIITQRNHLLMVLLFFELMILSLSMNVITILHEETLFFMMMILTLGACEASIGLALLVLMSRSFGSDLIKVLSSNKC